MQTEAASQIQTAFEHTVLNKKIESLKEETDLFSRTQDPDHFRNAVALKNELNEEGHPQSDILINTKELFEKGFSFNNVAEYDHVVQLLADVQNSQENLSQNEENQTLMDNFVATCKKVRKNLKSQYKEGWNDPGASYEDDDD